METSDKSPPESNAPSQARRIVVADADASYAQFIAGLLARLEQKIVVVHDGEALCDLVAAEAIDIAIIGMHTTRTRDFDLVRRIRRAGFRGPLILHATGLTEIEVSAYREIGVSMFVDKRTTIEALIEAIEIAIGGEDQTNPNQLDKS